MAIYSLSVKTFSRGKNQSAVKAAAYRSGDKLHDERLNETLDYTNKQQVIHTEIIAPDNAPEWANDREKLWNKVEAVEKRKDARVARELRVALPREFSQDQNKELVRDFAKNELVANGMIADVAIHESVAKDGELNPHAHILLTTREVSEEGFAAKKNRDWDKLSELKSWRKSWEDYTNDHLKNSDSDNRIDHRSLKNQGLDRQPTIHLGKEATAIEKNGGQSERGDRNRKIEHSNKLLSDKKRPTQNPTEYRKTNVDNPLDNQKWLEGKKDDIIYSKNENPFGGMQSNGSGNSGMLRAWMTEKAEIVNRIKDQARALAQRAQSVKQAIIDKYTKQRSPDRSEDKEHER